MVEQTEFRCQACGFRVFNRLYPFCESCKKELAPGIALSAAERTAYFAKQRDEDERKRLERQRRGRSAKSDAGDFDLDLFVDGGDG